MHRGYMVICCCLVSVYTNAKFEEDRNSLLKFYGANCLTSAMCLCSVFAAHIVKLIKMISHTDSI